MQRLLLVTLLLVVVTVGTAVACCDNPFPSTKPPEPTGFRVTVQSATSAVLQWDAVPCHQDWLIVLNEAYVYLGYLYYYTGPAEFMVALDIATIAYIDTDSELPYNATTPRKVYQLCIVNTHTGEQSCAARWVGLSGF